MKVIIFSDLVDKVADTYNEKVQTCIDIDDMICVYIHNIDKIYKRQYLSNLEGRGYTYEQACKNYINNMMDRKFNLRYKIRFYATTKLRTIIRKAGVP